MAAMTALEDAEQAGVARQLDLTYGYYRQPNGWITVSPATELEELVYRRDGWEPLLQYGRVEMGSTYAADHPLERLFMLGGAKELCVEQIVQSALHINPPLVPVCGRRLDQNHKRHNEDCWAGAKPVTFPQLKNPPPALQCKFCDRDDLPTKEAKNQHEAVAHKDEKGDIRMGETLAASLTEGLQSRIGVPASAEPQSSPYICGFCNTGFSNHMKLASHVKSDHKENAD